MARQAPSPAAKAGVSWHGNLSIDAREAMIREAAYYLAERRGFAPGHDLEDWLAAEASIDRDVPDLEAAGAPEFEMQQGGTHGPGRDDELKRIVRQHPQKGIPQVEGIDPREAPPRE
jgi:hypothetical protein